MNNIKKIYIYIELSPMKRTRHVQLPRDWLATYIINTNDTIRDTSCPIGDTSCPMRHCGRAKHKITRIFYHQSKVLSCNDKKDTSRQSNYNNNNNRSNHPINTI